MSLVSFVQGIKSKYINTISKPRRGITNKYVAASCIGLIITATAVILGRSHSSAIRYQQTYILKGVVKTDDQAALDTNIIISHNGAKIFKSRLSNTNYFEVSLEANEQYSVSASQDGYIPIVQNYKADRELTVEIKLNKAAIATVSLPLENPAPVDPTPVETPAAPKDSPKPVTSKSVGETPKTSASKFSFSRKTELSSQGILDQINIQRLANGLSRITLNSTLSSAAYNKAKNMSDNSYFAHVAPDGTDDWFFISQSGYTFHSAGVNLAMGDFGTSTNLIDQWMNSSGHRENILAAYGREVGIGIYGNYFVMMIAG